MDGNLCVVFFVNESDLRSKIAIAIQNGAPALPVNADEKGDLRVCLLEPVLLQPAADSLSVQGISATTTRVQGNAYWAR